ncbi:MAG TPA: class E sortase [Acidimicrobiales bacterium]|nr:class E sortase [Acidimicrobiales bacterium]
MTVRRVIGGVGRTMIGAGVLILLFVAYQLWGTGLAESRSQHALKRQFDQLLAPPSAVPSTTTPPVTDGEPPSTTTTTLDDSAAPAPAGQAVAIIKIPKIGAEKAVVQGITLDMLKKGPGHYPDTPLPGQPGNAAIAGHRTTYGAPFFRLNELSPGDPILVTTRQGRFRYEVRETRIVKPNDTTVLRPSKDNLLTLTTCNPRFSASQRLVVISVLKGEAAEAPPPTTTVPPTTAPPVIEPGATTVAPTTPPTTAPDLQAAEGGLSGRAAAKGPAIAWGLLAAAILVLMWLAGRAWKRWPVYLLGAPVFLVVLFVFFENFSRLLPSNY